MGEVVDARKTRIDAEEAWQLLKDAAGVAVVRGKKVETLNPGQAGREAVLALVLGPSGNLRAPTLRIGDHFLIGFHAELYGQLRSGK